MKVAILKNEFDDGHLNWAAACEKFKVEYNIIDLVSHSWLSEIQKHPYRCYLACPSGREAHYKIMYDERIRIIEKVMGKFVYPNMEEISIHENKKYLSYWLEANSIPHPKTYVFYTKKEAINALKGVDLPLVGKMNIGASGKGVTIFRDKQALLNYIETAFGRGIKQAWGPNLKMGNYANRLIAIVKEPSRILNRLTVYKKLYNELQKGFVILQEYIPHDYEWRIVKIGNSFFGHKKVKQGDKASGTKGITYDNPPVEILNFVKNICDKYKFNSMAVDLFEDGKGGYLVNEMQCIFGHVQDYICAQDNEPGRYLLKGDSWIFEKGNFNTNLSYDLRLENLLNLISD